MNLDDDRPGMKEALEAAGNAVGHWGTAETALVAAYPILRAQTVAEITAALRDTGQAVGSGDEFAAFIEREFGAG